MKITKPGTSVAFVVMTAFLAGIYSAQVRAGAATCEPANGSAVSYENTLIRNLLSQDNVKGASLNQAMNSPQQSYHISCDCTDSDASGANGVLIMYSLVSSLPLGHATNYYKITDHLDLMTQITLPKNGDVTVPTSKAVSDSIHHWDKDGTGICQQQKTQDTFVTGSQGVLTFYLTTPFVGEISIPRTEIARVYASSATTVTTAPPLGAPVAILYISGTLTAPQSCEINQGEVISVNFGTIQASHFTKLNNAPDNFRPVTFDIRYDCTSQGLPVIPTGDKLLMLLDGADVENQYYLVARRRPSDNTADIGIVVEDSSGIYMPFLQGVLPMNQNGLGKITLTAMPINLVGGELDTGDFQAMATLRVDIR